MECKTKQINNDIYIHLVEKSINYNMKENHIRMQHTTYK